MTRRIAGNVAYFCLIVLVALRPLISETYDSATSSFSRALETIADPTPLRTLIFDTVILTVALVAALIHRRDFASIARRAGLMWGFALLVVSGVISCIFAGNQRVAINATVDWLCLPILSMTLVVLSRGSWQRALLLAAIMGGACVQVLECHEQRIGFDETIAQYEHDKDAFWKKQGVEPDAPRVAMFEARMRSRETSGLMPHSSIAGSYLAIAAFCGVGLCLDRWRRRRELHDVIGLLTSLVLALVTVAIITTIPFTGSRGTMLAGAGVVLLWIIAAMIRRVVDAHRRAIFAAAWLGFGLTVAATIGHGLHHGSLPGASLAFRWHYWTASAALIADHAWTGVGRENFGRHYLRYKSIQAPEEVSNPHNLFVQAAADWGIPGLFGLIVLLLGGSWAIAGAGRARRNALADQPCPVDGSIDAPLSSVGAGVLIVALALIVALLRAALLGADDPNFLFYKSVTGVMVWIIGAGAVWFDMVRSMDTPASRNANGIIAAAIAWGLLAFLVHDLINFALFVPATATTLFALLAYVFSDRLRDTGIPSAQEPGETIGATSGGSWWVSVVLAVALGTTLWFGVIPAARSGAALARAQELARSIPGDRNLETHPARQAFERAARADALDPTPLFEQGVWLSAVAETFPAIRVPASTLAIDAFERALARDPWNAAVYRALQRAYGILAPATSERADYEQAIQAARMAMERYPHDPASMVSLADTLAAAGFAWIDAALISEAVETYQAALDLDEQRPDWETIRRFSERTRSDILRKIEVARDSLARHAPPGNE